MAESGLDDVAVTIGLLFQFRFQIFCRAGKAAIVAIDKVNVLSFLQAEDQAGHEC